MGKPAARLGDMHVCPAWSGTVPHVGGPVTGPSVSTVLIGGQPASVQGDLCTCCGPPDAIAMGSSGVFIGGRPSARQGDMTVHGGVIVVGLPTVLIGEVGSAVVSPSLGQGLAGGGNSSFAFAASAAGAFFSAASPAPASLKGAVAGAAEKKEKTKEKSWFWARVEDDDGNPVPGLAYRVKLPDGNEKTGHTPADGIIRISGIPPGKCEFCLTELDESGWRRK